MPDISNDALVSLSAGVVSAFVSNNSVRSTELPELIVTVHSALNRLVNPVAEAAPADDIKPAVSIKKSITDDYIISLEDGRKLKSMKRYLFMLGMTPDEYRAKWGLPRDYPMVAPNYAAHRSQLARAAGLGRKVAKAAAADPAASEPIAAPEPAPKPKRGRPARKAA